MFTAGEVGRLNVIAIRDGASNRRLWLGSIKPIHQNQDLIIANSAGARP